MLVICLWRQVTLVKLFIIVYFLYIFLLFVLMMEGLVLETQGVYSLFVVVTIFQLLVNKQLFVEYSVCCIILVPGIRHNIGRCKERGEGSRLHMIASPTTPHLHRSMAVQGTVESNDTTVVPSHKHFIHIKKDNLIVNMSKLINMLN